eukprot:937895-Pelagomonas_calceolata.AAC.1
MLNENVSPAADQPESRAVGQSPCNPSHTRQKDGQSHTEGRYSLLVHHARMWSGALTTQLVPSSNASLKLPDPMQQLHNEKYFAG